MNETFIFRLGTYIIFRLLHLLFLIESDVYALVLRLLDKQSSNDEVEVFNIFARHRFDSTDVTRESDFLSFHERTTLFEEICEEGWFIYSITDRYIYLVKISSVEKNFFEGTISIDKCSKLSNFLFQNAEKLARIQMDTFHRVTKLLPPFRSKVVLIHAVPCSGVTTVGKLLQACDSSKLSLLVIGEPPFLTALGLAFNHSSIEEMRRLSRSTLKFSLMHQKADQTIVLKARSCCTKVVPFIHAELPSIQHAFISRKNTNDAVSRLVMYTSTSFPLFSELCRINDYCSSLTGFLTRWRDLERETTIKIDPRTDVEYAMAQVYGSLIHYRRNFQYFVMNLPYLEDLISDTAVAIKPILDICEISDLAIPECIAWKRNAEETLRDVWDTVELSEGDSRRVKYLVDLLKQDVCMF